MAVTNNQNPPPTFFYNFQIFSNTYVPRWPGYTNNGNVALSFTNPLSATAILLTNSGFYFGTAPPGVVGFVTGFFLDGRLIIFRFSFHKLVCW